MSSIVPEDIVLKVVVIGGGCSGAVFALQLARMTRAPLAITIVEPRTTLGTGVAYSTADPAHRINVPAVRMAVFSEDPTHFDRWLQQSGMLEEDPGALWQDGQSYPCRSVFGRYLSELVAAEAGARPNCTIEHVQDRVQNVAGDGAGYRIETALGHLILADILVLATGHSPPKVPAAITNLIGDPGLVANPWQPGALDSIKPDNDILIIGTGLTMADVVASLDRRGHKGHITAFSRRGLLSRGHAAAAAPFAWFKDASVPHTALDLSRKIRELISAAEEVGIAWQSVLDDVRTNGQRVWGALDHTERRRLLRHIRAFWDVHRFRVAPQVEAVLRERTGRDSLRTLAATFRSAKRSGDKLEIGLHPRYSAPDVKERLSVDTVVVTTGPDHNSAITLNPALQSLAEQGLIRPDPLGLGLDVDLLSQAIGKDGRSRATLLVVGTMARGQFGELIGLPEVTLQAGAVASQLAERFLSCETPR